MQLFRTARCTDGACGSIKVFEFTDRYSSDSTLGVASTLCGKSITQDITQLAKERAPVFENIDKLANSFDEFLHIWTLWTNNVEHNQHYAITAASASPVMPFIDGLVVDKMLFYAGNIALHSRTTEHAIFGGIPYWLLTKSKVGFNFIA